MFKRLKMPRMIEKLCERPGYEWTEVEITAFWVCLASQPNYSTLYADADRRMYIGSSQADAGDAVSLFLKRFPTRVARTKLTPSNPEHYYVFQPLWWTCREVNRQFKNQDDYITDLEAEGIEQVDKELGPLEAILESEELKARPDRSRKLIHAIKSCLGDEITIRIFFLKYLIQLDASEIAKKVGLVGRNPAGAVRIRLMRAKNKLANCPDVKKALEDYK